MVLENRKYNVIDVVRLPLRCAPIHSILIAVLQILQGIVPSLQILVTAKFIDTAVSIVSSKGEIKSIFPSMFAIVGLIAYNWLSAQIIKFLDVKMGLIMMEQFRTAMVEKRAKLSYKYIENRESWDLISRVCGEPESKLKEAYNDLLSLISLIIRIVGILLILVVQVWWAALIIITFSVPLFILAKKGGEATYETNREVSKYKRKYEYLGGVLTGREGAEERTLFGFSDSINEKWWEQYETARKITLKTEGKWFIRMKTGGIVTSLISIFITIVLVEPVTSGTITVGLFISLVNSVFSIVQLMSWQLSYLVDQMAKHIEYLKDLTAFAALEEIEGATDKPLEESLEFKTLEFKNVKFKYPQTENYILNGISFVIEKGKHYAFVGVNGAGKTTITKLITGLYNEYEGEILINGKDIKEYSQRELKAFSSVVYQDFAKYFISFKDNISIGRVNGIYGDENKELISNAISTIELKDVIDDLPQGIDTPLGKIKSQGSDVSGGQWQRIAMARSIINPAPLRILDEPTAALDPISESNVYKKFEEISNGGTTIFISHRLGSTKLADEILVLGDGCVIERGTHNDLMNKNGVYAEMYESQRGWYEL